MDHPIKLIPHTILNPLAILTLLAILTPLAPPAADRTSKYSGLQAKTSLSYPQPHDHSKPQSQPPH